MIEKEMIVSPEAFEYVKESLGNGKSLSRSILENINLEAGLVKTCLPYFVGEDNAKDFRTGKFLKTSESSYYYAPPSEDGKLVMAPKFSSEEYLARLIEKEFIADRSSVCIFEDSLSRPQDPHLNNCSSNLFFYNNEVYYFMTYPDLINKKTSAVIRQAQSWLVIGIITSLPSGFEIRNRANIDLPLSKAITDNLKKVIISAYDGESYLIWEALGASNGMISTSNSIK